MEFVFLLFGLLFFGCVVAVCFVFGMAFGSVWAGLALFGALYGFYRLATRDEGQPPSMAPDTLNAFQQPLSDETRDS
jgi:hypothetical protein